MVVPPVVGLPTCERLPDESVPPAPLPSEPVPFESLFVDCVDPLEDMVASFDPNFTPEQLTNPKAKAVIEIDFNTCDMVIAPHCYK